MEHVKIVKMHSYTGHIPRYRNWTLTTPYTRPVFKSLLLDVPDAYIKTDKLEWSSAEAILKPDGFKATRYTRHLNNYQDLGTLESAPLLELMKQMSPIYWYFGFVPCPQLYRSNAPEIYKELCYEDDIPRNDSQLASLSPKSETKLVEGVRASEWRLYIRKQLMESRKYIFKKYIL